MERASSRRSVTGVSVTRASFSTIKLENALVLLARFVGDLSADVIFFFVDVNECDSFPCSHFCYNTIGSFRVRSGLLRFSARIWTIVIFSSAFALIITLQWMAEEPARRIQVLVDNFCFWIFSILLNFLQVSSRLSYSPTNILSEMSAWKAIKNILCAAISLTLWR